MQSERRGSGMTTERLAGVEADMTKRISNAWPYTYIGAAAGTVLACGMILAAGETIFSVTFDSKSRRSVFRNKPRGTFAQHDPAHQATEDTQAQLWFEQTRHAVQIRSYDGLKLHAWRFDANTAAPLPHTYVICMHGYTGGPEEMAPWAYHYANLGMRVLVPAQRAHELSEGRFVGMGWLEREDLLRWVNSIVASDPDARILLHGNSMGAATILDVCADSRLARNVVCAVVDSGFSSEYDQMLDSVSAMLHMPKWMAKPMVDCASLVNRLRLGFGFRQANAIEQLHRTTLPILFIQGDQDDIVSPHMLGRLYAACASPVKARLQVHGAGHTLSLTTDRNLYWSTVDAFLRRCLHMAD